MSRHMVLAGAQVDMLTTNWDLDIEYVAGLGGVKWHSVNAVHYRYLFPIGAREWLRQNIANYDLVHICKNWSLLAGMAASAAFSHGIPYVFSGMGLVSMRNRSRTLKWFFNKYMTIPMVHRANACIAVTDEEKDTLISAGVSSGRVHVIPNGIALDELSHRDSEHFRRQYRLDDRKIMLFIGRMDAIKGVSIIIDAFQRNRTKLSDWILVLVGTDTAYRRQMQQKVVEFDLTTSVYFLNPLFGEQKSEAYHAAEFVVVPSIKDAMTFIAPEAACCAKPVLITNTSGFGELARCGGAIEVDPTVEGLSGGLDILTSGNCDREEMGRMGYDYVAREFLWEKLALKFMEVFQSVSERGTSGSSDSARTTRARHLEAGG